MGRGVRLGFGKFKSKKSNLGGNVDAKDFRPANKEASSATNDSFEPPAHDHRGALLAPTFLIPESSLNKKEGDEGLASTDPAIPNESGRSQAPSKGVKAATARNEEVFREGHPQRSPLPISHREVLTRSAKEVAKAPDSSSHSQVHPKNSLPLPGLADLFYDVMGQGRNSEIPGVAAARLAMSEELPATGEKDSSEKLDRRRGLNTFKGTPPILALTMRLGKGPGTIAPKGADPQGPSPVDHGLELEAEFPHEMVSEMQNNAARKARRTVIGHTLGGRPTFKALYECLKFHLPASFTSTTLLTRGYFLISFENEEGAIATRKLTTVDWSGLSLSFSRFSPDFNSSAQGAEALLTHTIKVQFPNLHEQFRNAKALTIMASKLGAVLEIEAAESYIKRPVGPMVTVKV